MGELYADIAVDYARQINQSAFLLTIIVTIQGKLLRGELKLGPTELGFYDRLSRLAYVGSMN